MEKKTGLKKNREKNFGAWLYVVFVVGVLAAGFALLLVLTPKSYSASENRYLAKWPEISAEGVLSGEVQRDLTEAASDQFPARDLWMRIATASQYLLYHREINGVYIGKDGALFNKVTDSDLSGENYRTNLGYVTAMAAEADADVSVMLIPTPATVLTEKLPKYGVTYDSASYEEQGELLCEKDSVRWVQTREALTRALRDNKKLYFNTDHHWTTDGAYVGASVYLATQNAAIPDQSSFDVQTASEDFYGTIYSKVSGLPGISPDVLELPQALPDGLIIETSGAPADSPGADGEKTMPKLEGIYDRSKLDAKDKYAVYFGGNYGWLSITNPAAEGKGRLLIFKDSYANSMVPYLLGEYEQIMMVDLRYYNDSVSELVGQGWDEVLVCYEMSNFINERNIFKLIQ